MPLKLRRSALMSARNWMLKPRLTTTGNAKQQLKSHVRQSECLLRIHWQPHADATPDNRTQHQSAHTNLKRIKPNPNQCAQSAHTSPEESKHHSMHSISSYEPQRIEPTTVQCIPPAHTSPGESNHQSMHSISSYEPQRIEPTTVQCIPSATTNLSPLPRPVALRAPTS